MAPPVETNVNVQELIALFNKLSSKPMAETTPLPVVVKSKPVKNLALVDDFEQALEVATRRQQEQQLAMQRERDLIKQQQYLLEQQKLALEQQRCDLLRMQTEQKDIAELQAFISAQEEYAAETARAQEAAKKAAQVKEEEAAKEWALLDELRVRWEVEQQDYDLAVALAEEEKQIRARYVFDDEASQRAIQELMDKERERQARREARKQRKEQEKKPRKSIISNFLSPGAPPPPAIAKRRSFIASFLAPDLSPAEPKLAARRSIVDRILGK